MLETNIRELNEKIEKESQFIDLINLEMNKVIVGQKHMTERLMIGLLANGHILLEGVPGLAKTLAINSLSNVINAKFSRIQFTPDLLPADLTGTMIYSQKKEEFSVKKGPIFANFILADEINRSPAKVQSALLEAMQERQVTMDGTTYPLPKPFMVLATQNPVEFEGTFPLPEAQLDRFMLKIDMGYPTHDEEAEIIHRLAREHPIESLSAIATPSEVEKLIPQVWDVNVDETVVDYLIRLVEGTRNHPDILLGASPRASLALYKTSQALAAIQGRDHVLPDDVKTLAIPVLSHRLMLKPETELRGVSNINLVERILDETPLKLQDKEE
jgi:MoxR-like ATPase